MLSIAGSDREAKLEFGEGPDWGSMEHFSRFESNDEQKEFREVRQFKTHLGFPVIDIDVRWSNGTRSRLIGTIGQTAKYAHVSSVDAARFDEIMNSVRLRAVPVRFSGPHPPDSAP